MDEFNLSDKGVYDFNGDLKKETDYCYLHDDVKEFIKKLKENFNEGDIVRYSSNELNQIINKLAGDKLI
jgi:hypothetical protein